VEFWKDVFRKESIGRVITKVMNKIYERAISSNVKDEFIAYDLQK
jgi:hypothetical protein